LADGANTIVILGAACSLMLLGMGADLTVQLNKQRYNVIRRLVASDSSDFASLRRKGMADLITSLCFA
jgi:hypothetical protein